ncbi:HigA family addiction module antidote protein [Aeromicrobium tamlense]|uniref:Addiction module HigA family antidote n=1 Tax=Aeromicrobium tamlense TaxID=375541 RepID=A0A8I0KHV9_9ACTN|nr:HigA family addiction module antitoxin [Aeromicrobium tamlense]MBD1269945.1 HigA family addiction module antidote protein [Aeromicrobium tamlense]NYI39398.1 addiction module HigA family antidote [Aeromicrobium tamlense]
MTTLAPIHPGEVLLEEFLQPMEMSRHLLAVSIGVPPRRIDEIVRGKRHITTATAQRLARFFGTNDRFWLNLQTRFELESAKDGSGDALNASEPLHTSQEVSG